MKTFTAKLLTVASVAARRPPLQRGLSVRCGTGGYSYAGVSASSPAFGIGATVTPLAGFNVLNGHVAGWVGVGGPARARTAPTSGSRLASAASRS